MQSRAILPPHTRGDIVFLRNAAKEILKELSISSDRSAKSSEISDAIKHRHLEKMQSVKKMADHRLQERHRFPVMMFGGHTNADYQQQC